MYQNNWEKKQRVDNISVLKDHKTFISSSTGTFINVGDKCVKEIKNVEKMNYAK